MQPRATINLAKAKKLIDDRSQLTKKETSARGGGRRKSAFAEEEEGYMFVEEGFRLRFANGETIDFYAENAADKDGWMKVLADAIGKESSSSVQRAWTSLVLAKERQHGKPAAPSPVKTTQEPQETPQSLVQPQNQPQDVQSAQPVQAVKPAKTSQVPRPSVNQRPYSAPKSTPRKNIPTSPAKQNFSHPSPSAERRREPSVPKSPWLRADRRQQLRSHTRDKVRSMVL